MIRGVFFYMAHRIAVLFLYVILAGVSLTVAQQPPAEEVVVTANAYPVPFENLSRSVTVLTRGDIENLPVHSVAGILELAASIDMRARAPFGIQTDISARGASFAQTLVLVDGVRINDSQTGHHNSDFPVQLQDIERIEVLLGPGSSIYGADAFGGTVNIITRRNAGRMSGSISGGQNEFIEGSFSAGFRTGSFEQSFSVTANRSAGFEYDRDFRNISASARTGIGAHSTLFVSHINKEFGANGFYGPSPSREWTNQTFVTFGHSFERKSGTKVEIQGYYRTHGDQFLYDTRTPDLFKSSHRTHSSGVLAKAHYVLKDSAAVTFGGELGGDWIVSSNLGDHSFARTSLFSEIQWTFGKKAALYPGVRFDYFTNFGSSVSPSLSGSWWVMPRVRLRSSIGRAFRIPTFTELYYHDPNNQANADLKPETAWSAEIGSDFVPAKSWMASLTFFGRRERNVIDWVRSSTQEKWRTANMRRLQTSGAEVGLERALGPRAGISAHYTRIFVDPGSINYISKYVLDYARDSWTGSGYVPLPLKLSYRQSINYKRRSDGRSYWLLDGGLERRFGGFAAALDFSNLLNSRYQEVIGVDMPGRWFILTFRRQ
jgi:iron complex outermembrane receptor protein